MQYDIWSFDITSFDKSFDKISFYIMPLKIMSFDIMPLNIESFGMITFEIT